MAISDTAIIENSSKSLFIEQPEKKYTKISKDLHRLMMTGCSQCTAAAYQTYSFCISMHPDSIITPAKIAEILKTIAEKNGGKALSERTIRRHLAMLEKVNLVEREYLKDKEGKFLGGLWRFFSLLTAGQKRPMDKLDDNVIELKEKISKKQNEPIGQKWPPVYNKERARVSNTNSKIKKQQQPETGAAVDCVVSFDERIEKILEDRSDIQREWIKNSLKIKGQTVENIVSWIKESGGKDNPTGFIRSALEKGWEFDSNKRQSLTPSSSDENQPFNQQKYMAIQEIKDKYFEELKHSFLKQFKSNEIILNYYNNMSIDRMKTEGDFKKFVTENYEAYL